MLAVAVLFLLLLKIHIILLLTKNGVHTQWVFSYSFSNFDLKYGSHLWNTLGYNLQIARRCHPNPWTGSGRGASKKRQNAGFSSLNSTIF